MLGKTDLCKNFIFLMPMSDKLFEAGNDSFRDMEVIG
jgi:hypothetical protein